MEPVNAKKATKPKAMLIHAPRRPTKHSLFQWLLWDLFCSYFWFWCYTGSWEKEIKLCKLISLVFQKIEQINNKVMNCPTVLSWWPQFHLGTRENGSTNLSKSVQYVWTRNLWWWLLVGTTFIPIAFTSGSEVIQLVPTATRRWLTNCWGNGALFASNLWFLLSEIQDWGKKAEVEEKLFDLILYVMETHVLDVKAKVLLISNLLPIPVIWALLIDQLDFSPQPSNMKINYIFYYHS